MVLLEAEKLQQCAGAALLLLEQPCCCCWGVPRGVPLLWALLDAPTAGEGPWALCAHQTMALYHFFLSMSLKIFTLCFKREMQHENLKNNCFLFRQL